MEREHITVSERYPFLFSKVIENLKIINGGVISFDIDAVTQKTYVGALNKASHKFGKYICIEDLKTYWALADITQKNIGTSKDESMIIAKKLWNNNEVYRQSPLMPGISNLLAILDEANMPYVFISSRPAEFLEITKKFFKEKLPFVNPDNIIMKRTGSTPGGIYKAEMIDKYGVLLHIEDAIEEASSIVEATPASVLMVPQPWNDHDRFQHSRIKYLGPFIGPSEGSYPVLRFLASDEAGNFLKNVAHY